MAKPTTKYQQILNDARERVEEAGSKVEALEKDLSTAEAVFQSLHKSYIALQRALTPTPRKASTKKQASAPAQQDRMVIEGAKCGICGNIPGHPDHDTEHYLGAHAFELPKPVARVPRKSKQKSESTPSIQSIEGETENVLAASSGGD